MQDLLLEASKIKNAQLKERPGRQAWEQAPDFFRYTAFQTDAETASARNGPLEERVQLATVLKDQGNAAFGQDVAEALQQYVKAIGVFMWFDRGRDKASEDIPLVSTLDAKAVAGQPEADVEKARQLVATCFSNAALCLLRQQRHQDAIYACSKALELDPYSVKALYRRADGYHHLGTTAALELCVMDLQEAQKLEPGNTQVRSTLDKYKAQLRDQWRKDKETFTGMFRGGSLYQEDDEEGNTASTSGQQGKDKERLHSKMVEADKALRSIQKNVAKVRANEHVAKAGRPGLLQREAEEEERRPNSFMAVMSHVPWWGWLIIALHLAYRTFKIWSGAQHGKGPFIVKDPREL